MTRIPHVRNPFDKGDVLVGAGGMRVPGILEYGQLHRFFLREHRRLSWHNHIDVALLLEPRDRCAIKKPTVFH